MARIPILAVVFLCVRLTALAQTPAVYDSTLAQRLGADERGMRMYTLVLLKPGPRADIPKAERGSLFRGHMANIGRMAKVGQLVLAGPFEENPTYAGLYVFTTPTKAATEPLLHTDPAIAGGALAYEMYEWYGSAGVMEMPALHERIQEKKF